ncbi:MAG: hypothetical protein ACRDRO_14240 [Pseudonocardiaceae bacterium]
MNTDQDTTQRVVRRLGSEQTHVADIHPDQLHAASHRGKEFTGVTLPLVARCGALLRDTTGTAVCMRPGTPIRCSRCSRITGLTEACDDNESLTAGTR